MTFQQFCDFCQLLNSLSDFEIAMVMFTIAGCSVSEDEFGRAARACLGKPLDKSVVTLVFNIFDVDGDKKLSYKEFVSVMKSWKLRGLKVFTNKTVVELFCLSLLLLLSLLFVLISPDERATAHWRMVGVQNLSKNGDEGPIAGFSEP